MKVFQRRALLIICIFGITCCNICIVAIMNFLLKSFLKINNTKIDSIVDKIIKFISMVRKIPTETISCDISQQTNVVFILVSILIKKL